MIPVCAGQGSFKVNVQDENRAAPSTNATLIFSALDGTNPRRFETNRSGEATVDIPEGFYRTRAFVPNETGELWFEDDVEIDPADAPIVLVRNMPTVGRKPEIAGSEAASDGSAVFVPVGQDLDVRVAIKYNGTEAGAKDILARARLVRGNVTLFDGVLGNATLDGAGWINGTLEANETNPYHAQEALTTLRVTLLLNGTSTAFDASDPVTVVFRDGCTGDAVQLRLTLDATTVPLCESPDGIASWQQWTTQANALVAARGTWWKRFETNATNWSYPDAAAARATYLLETSNLTANVYARLDAAQTDEEGFPTWQQVGFLRAILARNHTKIENAFAAYADAEQRSLAGATFAYRAQTTGLIVFASILSAGAAVGACAFITQRWKRRAEYWIGYSSRETGTSPLWWTFAVSGGLALLGIVMTFASPLWRLLGGTA